MRQKAIGRFSGLFVENRQEWKQGKWLGEYWNRPGRRGWYRDQGTGVGVLRSGRYFDCTAHRSCQCRILDFQWGIFKDDSKVSCQNNWKAGDMYSRLVRE